MSTILAGLIPDELFRLACEISRAEGCTSGVYVECGNPAQRDLFAELLKIGLDVETAYREATR